MRQRDERLPMRPPHPSRSDLLSLTPCSVSLSISAMAVIVALTAVFNQYCAIRCVQARKAHNCPYPNLYLPADAPGAAAYNCVQRAHANFLEALPIAALLIGTTYTAAPRLAVGMAALWLAGRVAYQHGYTTGGPSGRMAGAAVGSLTLLVAMGTALIYGVKTLMG